MHRVFNYSPDLSYNGRDLDGTNALICNEEEPDLGASLLSLDSSITTGGSVAAPPGFPVCLHHPGHQRFGFTFPF